jgi:hypothetical protein
MTSSTTGKTKRRQKRGLEVAEIGRKAKSAARTDLNL